MTERITLSIKPEKRKVLERLAKKHKTTMSGILDDLLGKQDEIDKSTPPNKLLGDLFASLTLKDEFASAKSPKELIGLLRTSKAEKR